MKKSNYRWVLVVTLLAFVLSVLMSLFLTIVLENVTLTISLLITFLFILLGVIFDIIGVAATAGDEAVFHAMSSKKLKTGAVGVKLIKNASKVSSICCDVVGDICGIISGSAGVTIVTILVSVTNMNLIVVSLLVTSLISALTIGGKALGKNLAINKSTKVLVMVARMLSIFSK